VSGRFLFAGKLTGIKSPLSQQAYSAPATDHFVDSG